MNTWETLFGFVVLFVLGMGLFTIVNMVIKLIKGNKSGIPKNQNPPPQPQKTVTIYINGKPISVVTELPQLPPYPGKVKPVLFEGTFSAPILTEEEIKQRLLHNQNYDLLYRMYGITLYDRLRFAVESEDYEEAARLRDLINKQ